MNVQHLPMATLLLAICLAAAAGCIAPPSPQVPDTPPAIPQVTALTLPETSLPPVTATPVPATPAEPATSPVVSPVPASSPASPPAPLTLIPKAEGRNALDDPRITRMTFTKEWLPFDIPDCAMRAEFAEIAGNPGYGIRQKEPALVLMPDATMSAFLRKYAGRYADDPNPVAYITPAEIGGTACSTGLGNPKWNFVLVNITLMPRNARPAEYDIGLNIRSQGSVVHQIRLNRTFLLDRPVEIDGFIPLTVGETEVFDSIDLVFARRKT